MLDKKYFKEINKAWDYRNEGRKDDNVSSNRWYSIEINVYIEIKIYKNPVEIIDLKSIKSKMRIKGNKLQIWMSRRKGKKNQ